MAPPQKTHADRVRPTDDLTIDDLYALQDIIVESTTNSPYLGKDTAQLFLDLMLPKDPEGRTVLPQSSADIIERINPEAVGKATNALINKLAPTIAEKEHPERYQVSQAIDAHSGAISDAIMKFTDNLGKGHAARVTASGGEYRPRP